MSQNFWGYDWQARADEEFLEAEADVGPDADGGMDESEEVVSSGLPWEGSDRDYIYEELLGERLNSFELALRARLLQIMKVAVDFSKQMFCCCPGKHAVASIFSNHRSNRFTLQSDAASILSRCRMQQDQICSST